MRKMTRCLYKGVLFAEQFRFLGNYPPTPPLSQHFALSEKYVIMLVRGGVGGQFPRNLS